MFKYTIGNTAYAVEHALPEKQKGGYTIQAIDVLQRCRNIKAFAKEGDKLAAMKEYQKAVRRLQAYYLQQMKFNGLIDKEEEI